jgi:hypothetical protein
MLNHLAALVALRTRALTLSVCTTGSTTLTATTTGYSRADGGSFLTDGFAVGMEITPSGFATNTIDVLAGVTATTLTTRAARVAETGAAGRTIAVGLPALRAWENVDFTPTSGRWFVDEDYLPGPAEQITLGALGQVETLPQYVLKLYGTSGAGPAALYKAADALLTLFAPRTALTLSTGDVLTVRTSPAPYRGQLLTADAGWSLVTLTVPLRSRSANTI